MAELIIDQGLLTWIIGFLTVTIGGIIAYFFRKERTRAIEVTTNTMFQKVVSEAIQKMGDEIKDINIKHNDLQSKFFAHMIVSTEYITRLKFVEKATGLDLPSETVDRRPVKS